MPMTAVEGVFATPEGSPSSTRWPLARAPPIILGRKREPDAYGGPGARRLNPLMVIGTVASLGTPPLLGTTDPNPRDFLRSIRPRSRDDHKGGGPGPGPGGRHRYDPTGPRRSLRLARRRWCGLDRPAELDQECESCQGEQICQHGRGAAPAGRMCSCSLTDPAPRDRMRCPCDPWSTWTLRRSEPLAINSFLGGAGDEPRVLSIPLFKSQLVAAARQELTEGEVDPAEPTGSRSGSRGNLPRSRGSDDGGEPRVPVERARRADARLEASEAPPSQPARA